MGEELDNTVSGADLAPQVALSTVTPPETSPAASGGGLLAIVERLANVPNPNIDAIERLLQRRRDEQDREALRAFNAALAAAKGELEPVVKRRDVDFPGKREGSGRVKYRYEEFADVARVVDPVFQKYGLSYRFRVAQQGKTVRVTTILSHALGHSEETAPLEETADPGQTGMSQVQALGATLTYLQRYSLRASIGLAAGKDTDGIATSPPIEADQIRELADLIAETGSSEVTMLRLIGAPSIAEMTLDQYTRTKEVLGLRKIEQRKRHAPAGDA